MGLIDFIIGFFIKRDIDKLKGTTEWQQQINKINSSREKIEELHISAKKQTLIAFTNVENLNNEFISKEKNELLKRTTRKRIKKDLGLHFMSDEDFVSYLNLSADDEERFFLSRYKANRLAAIKDAYLLYSCGKLSEIINNEKRKGLISSGYRGTNCIWCGQTIQTSNFQGQFCSLNCQHEFNTN
jgi:hypothetical protein